MGNGKTFVVYYSPDLIISNKELSVLIEHFNKYPLITKKRADFELFKRAVDLIYCKEHLTMNGLNKIISIKASMSKGLSEELKFAFPNVTPVIRPIVDLAIIKDPNWIKTHDEEYKNFIAFQKTRVFKMPAGQYYQNK